MSFDILFQTCNLGTKKKSVTNPFTREKMMTYDDPGLTKQEKAAVMKLLKSAKAKGPDESGAYQVEFADGGEADLLAEGLAGGKMDGCSAQTHVLTDQVAQFLFRLCDVGGMMITPVMEKGGTFVTTAERLSRVKGRYPDVRVVETQGEFRQVLTKGFGAFQKYRKKVTRGK
jgi:hypothetical protein